MEELELDEKNCQIVFSTLAEQAQGALLGWRMLENNEIPGILPFDYYYIDDRVYFRCSYAPFERIDCYFHKKQGDFESILCICEGILKILERGDEYLLGREGYLLLPEWIFWNRFERKAAVCYFPGRAESAREEYMALVEYLLQHTDHSDKRAVSMIYGLYDMIASENFVVENFLSYLQKSGKNKGAATEAVEEKKAEEEKNLPKQKEKKEKEKKERGTVREKKEEKAGIEEGNGCCFFLNPVKNSSMGRLQGRIAEEQKPGGCMKEGQEIVIGRQTGCDIYLPFDVISRRHAVFIYEGGKLYVMDVSSKNGTYLNGKKISAYVKTQCRGDDVITFADISYHFEINRKC